MKRRTLLIGLAAAVGSSVASLFYNLSAALGTAPAKSPGPIRTEGKGPIRSVSIRPVPLGGGGFICEVGQSADGSRFVCRTDVSNAYVRDAGDTAWRTLFSPATMLPSDYDPLPAFNGKADGQGVAGICIAPSNKDVIYASFYGYIWRSTDGGKSIRRTALPQKKMPSNGGVQRVFNRAIDIHPKDPDQVLVSTWGEGTWCSTDGGRGWHEVKLPPAATNYDGAPGLSLVLFGHNPDHVYIFVGGVGLHVSRTGVGGPFSPLAGGPSRCSSLVKSSDGAVHLCEFDGTTTGYIWRHHPDQGWSKFKTPHEMITVTVDPKNPKRIFASGPYGYGIMTTDGGATVVHQKIDYTKAGSEVSWICDLVSLIVGQVAWDVNGGDTIWYATGVGVIKADVGAEKLTDWSAGIEELIGISGVSVPGGKAVLTAWDKPLWPIKDENAYGNRPAFPYDPMRKRSIDPIGHGTDIDYAPDDPKYLVGLVGVGGSFDSVFGPGFSTDGGDNWTIFPNAPPRGWGMGGSVAVSTRDNFVLLPSNNSFGAYTLDGGRTWETIRLDGKNETSDFANSFYVNRRNVTADKTRKGAFALVYTLVQAGTPPLGNPLGGVWVTKDGGRTWQQTLRGLIGKYEETSTTRGQDPRQFWQCQIDYVPGFSGELIYTPHADNVDDPLWWSVDDGATWKQAHRSIRNVVSFGFGKPAPGQQRPAFYFYGSVDDVTGVYASFDWFATKPVLLSRHPSPQLALIAYVMGDANRFGRIWLGTGGAGWLLVDIELNGSGSESTPA